MMIAIWNVSSWSVFFAVLTLPVDEGAGWWAITNATVGMFACLDFLTRKTT